MYSLTKEAVGDVPSARAGNPNRRIEAQSKTVRTIDFIRLWLQNRKWRESTLLCVAAYGELNSCKVGISGKMFLKIASINDHGIAETTSLSIVGHGNASYFGMASAFSGRVLCLRQTQH
jgi:hypothetical protein